MYIVLRSHRSAAFYGDDVGRRAGEQRWACASVGSHTHAHTLTHTRARTHTRTHTALTPHVQCSLE